MRDSMSYSMTEKQLAESKTTPGEPGAQTDPSPASVEHQTKQVTDEAPSSEISEAEKPPSDAVPLTPKELKDYFLTRDEHLTARTCAKLCMAMDRVLPRPAGVSTPAERATYPGLFNYVNNTHCVILVRQHEVVAVVISGTRIDFTNDTTDVIKVKDPRIVIAANPREIEYKKIPGFNQSGSHKITITKVDVPGTIPPGAPGYDVISRHITELRASSTNSIEFEWHVQLYFMYLRDVHSATDEDAHHLASERLQDYVFVVSHPKMLSRFAACFKPGGSDTPAVNFWELVTRPAYDMPAHAAQIEMPAHLAGRTPTDRQAQIILGLWSGSSDYSKVYAARPIYDTPQDRSRFQDMLRHVLFHTYQKLLQLQQQLSMFVSSSSLPIQIATNIVRSFLKDARDWMALLHDFLTYFDEFVIDHYKWLAEAANVTSFKHKPTWTPVDTTTPAHAVDDELPTAPVKQAEAPPTIDQEELEAADDDDTKDADDIEHDVEDQQTKDAMKQLKAGLPITRDPYRPFASACRAFTRRPMFHLQALRRAIAAVPGRKTASQEYESALVNQAQVAVVKMEMQRWDKEMKKVTLEFLKKLQKCKGCTGLKPEKLLTSLGDISKVLTGGLTKSTTTVGTTHCEAILMCLIAIAKDAEILAYIDDGWLQHNGIFATLEDLLNMFPDVIDFHGGSKKNCPPCDILRSEMFRQDITKTEFVACGSHTKWSGYLLPAHIPRKLGAPVLEEFMEVTGKKLLEWQNTTVEPKNNSTPQSDENQDDISKSAQPASTFPVGSQMSMSETVNSSVYGFSSPSPGYGGAGASASDAATVASDREQELDSSVLDDAEAASAILPERGITRKGRDFTTETQGDKKREKGEQEEDEEEYYDEGEY